VRLLFVGQYIRRKGIDLMLRALGPSRGGNWHLNLIGSGPEQAEFTTLAESQGLNGQVTFTGPMPNPEAMSVLAGADVLILPSRFDGYGAVVNEALMRGVPAICSVTCGASQVLRRDPAAGSVFDSQASLEAALQHWIATGRRTAQRSERVRELAACVTPPSGAAYFREVMEHVYHGKARPTPPWRRTE
jgi:glycosyltransferase involved in cell wall biosynthesis